jgi:glyoxylase I family protein
MSILGVHHIAIICSDFQKSRQFYCDVLGLKIIREVYREQRKSYKLDLSLNDHYIIELFSFPDPPSRVSQPEACGLRHLAFAVDNLESEISRISAMGVKTEEIRTDELTGKKFAFFSDPDGLPLELYEK